MTDNSRLLESRDTRIPENVETITRTADVPRKRASPPQEGPTSRKRQASPPGSPERPTYVRTFTGDTDYNPQSQRVIQEIPREIRVPNPLPLDPPDIVILPATARIIDYEQQTAAFRAAGGGPDPNAAHPVRPPIPRYIHDRTSPINVPAVQFATPNAAPTALVVGGRAVDDGSRPISAIALQTVLYVLNVNASGIIGQEAAREFFEHSQRWTNNYDVGQVISTKAVRCIDDQIHTDQDYPYAEETRKVWLQTLTVPQVAQLVLRYFRADTMTIALLERIVHWSLDVLEFARQQEVADYLDPLLTATKQLFPDAMRLAVYLEADPEIEGDRHIALEVEIVFPGLEAYLDRNRRWIAELCHICPAPLTCVFRLLLMPVAHEPA